MQKEKNIKSYSGAELKAKQLQSQTDLTRLDAQTDAELERLIATDADERDLQVDWTQAKLVFPKARQSVHLRLDPEVVAFFKSQGKGHISRMQAVLKAYADAHRAPAK